MKYQIVGRGIEVTPAMKEQAIKKLARMEKYFDPTADVKCTVTFSIGHYDQTVEVAIATKDIDLRAKVASEDAYSSIDLVLDKLEGQMRKMKTQLLNLQKKNSVAEDMRLDMLQSSPLPQSLEKIVKKKTLILTPMDADEALARMDALDHSFFIYLDSKTGNTCVLYRRDEGDYGVISVSE